MFSMYSTLHSVTISHCFHSCLQPIVGARFHCAICESVDICSNCESAGLPGNLNAADGGHNSSHIMIKVRRLLPFPTLSNTDNDDLSDPIPARERRAPHSQPARPAPLGGPRRAACPAASQWPASPRQLCVVSRRRDGHWQRFFAEEQGPRCRAWDCLPRL